MTRPSLTDDQRAQVLHLAAAGLPPAEIALRTGISTGTIICVCRDEGHALDQAHPVEALSAASRLCSPPTVQAPHLRFHVQSRSRGRAHVRPGVVPFDRAKPKNTRACARHQPAVRTDEPLPARARFSRENPKKRARGAPTPAFERTNGAPRVCARADETGGAFDRSNPKTRTCARPTTPPSTAGLERSKDEKAARARAADH